MSRCTRSSSSLASFACASSSPSPRSASSISGVNWPLSISASRIACLQRVERAVARLVEAHAVVRMLPLAAGKAGLEQEVRELVEQRLEIDRVGHLRRELAVGVEAHGEPPPSVIPPGRAECHPSPALYCGRARADHAQSVPRRPPAPELPPVPDRPDALADRHVDADDGTGLARARADEQRLLRRPRRDGVGSIPILALHDARRRHRGPRRTSSASCASRRSRSSSRRPRSGSSPSRIA